MNELIQIGPISPLRQRLIDDMTMRRFSKETQRNYLRDVGRFATWLGRSPHTASAEDIRQFQIEQQQAGVPAPTMNSIVGALRFAEQRAGGSDTLFFPVEFGQYLKNYTYAGFNPGDIGRAGSRHAVSHGAVASDLYTMPRALQALLTLDQLAFYT